jgi:bifunctional pyridoxal-dependent enzyme with beta-cystathionase and maltose regulon repressor activities
MPDAINAYFLKQTGVALNNGDAFEAPGFVRMNFALPRSQLKSALQRMVDARSAAGTVS